MVWAVDLVIIVGVSGMLNMLFALGLLEMSVGVDLPILGVWG